MKKRLFMTLCLLALLCAPALAGDGVIFPYYAPPAPPLSEVVIVAVATSGAAALIP